MSSASALAPFPRQTDNTPAPPALLRAKTATSARVGLVLLDSSLHPMYCNSEAISIFAYPGEPRKVKLSSAEFYEQIRSIIPRMPSSDQFPLTAFFVSGRRRYVCRSFLSESEFNVSAKPVLAMTVERNRWVLRDLVMLFQLTDREMEAVEHLAEGLTSKEIAQRMNISPNTVKTFLRLVMIKMGVTTRSGVIGKLIHAAHFGFS
jgi:DNA-binding CsgD family transcriptional regulator